MSLIETKQIIHIVCELIVITTVTVYFNYKFNSLQKSIEELENKIQQQHEILVKHDEVIKSLIETVNNLQSIRVTSEKKSTNFPVFSPSLTPNKVPQFVSQMVPNMVPQFVPRIPSNPIEQKENEKESENIVINTTTTNLEDLDLDLDEEEEENKEYISNNQSTTSLLSLPLLPTQVIVIDKGETYVNELCNASECYNNDERSSSSSRVEEIIEEEPQNKSQSSKKRKRQKLKQNNNTSSSIALKPFSPALSEELDAEIEEELKDLQVELQG